MRRKKLKRKGLKTDDIITWDDIRAFLKFRKGREPHPKEILEVLRICKQSR